MMKNHLHNALEGNSSNIYKVIHTAKHLLLKYTLGSAQTIPSTIKLGSLFLVQCVWKDQAYLQHKLHSCFLNGSIIAIHLVSAVFRDMQDWETWQKICQIAGANAQNDDYDNLTNTLGEEPLAESNILLEEHSLNDDGD